MTAPVRSRESTDWSSYATDDLACTGPLETPTTSTSSEEPGSITEGGVVTPSAGIRGPSVEGNTLAGDHSIGAFALRGRDPNTGVELDVFSAGAHVGPTQIDANAAMASIGASSADSRFRVGTDVFTARAHLGMQNPDGSVGFNAGLSGTIVGAEGTATAGPVAVTLGASIGWAAGVSLGVRDADHDGKAEICGRIEYGVGTAGVCVEKWW
jgi:hypothetical protein